MGLSHLGVEDHRPRAIYPIQFGVRCEGCLGAAENMPVTLSGLVLLSGSMKDAFMPDVCHPLKTARGCGTPI